MYEAAIAASLPYSSGPFLDLLFAFAFSGETFVAVSLARASSLSLADSRCSTAFSCDALVLYDSTIAFSSVFGT